MGSTGPRSPRDDADGADRAWGTDFPAGHHPRHGARAEAPDRPSRHCPTVRRDRRLDGRDAGAGVGGDLSRRGFRRRAGRRRRRTIPRRTSPSTRSAGRRSSPTRTGRAGATGEHGGMPARGLAVARMVAHITYLSERALTRKFGRRLQARRGRREAISLFGDMFEVESYLRHQGSSFVRPLRRQLLSHHHPRDGLFRPRRRARRRPRRRLPRAPARASAGLASPRDWLFPTDDSRGDRARAEPRRRPMSASSRSTSDKGHDAFLLDEPDFHRTLGGFLAGCAEHAGLPVNLQSTRSATSRKTCGSICGSSPR